MSISSDMVKIIKKDYIIIVLIAVALLIRLVGVQPGHNHYHPDEPMSYSSAVDMLLHGDFNPRRFDYPSGVPLLHNIFYRLFILPAVSFPVFLSNPSSLITAVLDGSSFLMEYNQAIFGSGWINALFWSRYFNAILGVFCVFLTYIIGMRLFNKVAGLAAAFFLAFNYRHVLSSHLALSDIPNAFFALLAFYSCILLLEKNTKLRYLFCGLCIGISFSMKYQILALFPLLFIQLLWVFRRRNAVELFNPNFLLSLMTIPIVFVLLNPYLFINLKEALPVVKGVSMRYGIGLNRFNFYPLYYLYHFGIGALPFFAIIIGFVIAVIRFPLKTLLSLAYVFPFFFIFFYYMSGGVYTRNFTTIIPFVMLYAGVSFGFLWQTLARIIDKKMLALFLVMFILIVNANSIKDSTVLSVSYAKPWNRDLLQNWAITHLPSDAKIRNGLLGVNWTHEKFLTSEITPWDHTYINSIAELAEAGDDFAVWNGSWYQIYFYWFDTYYKQLLKEQGIPYRKLLDSYYGLALSEFLDYTVSEFYKPWQAPDNNYLVVKIPPKLEFLGERTKTYDFNKDTGGFKGYNFSAKVTKTTVLFDRHIGKGENGSLEIPADTIITEMSRVTSAFIPVNPRNTYTVEGFIKSETEINAQNSDLFLRIDFFEDNNLKLLERGGIKKAVSGRIFGPSEWQKRYVFTKTPDEARYITISFQRSRGEFGHRYWVDDIAVYESTTEPAEKFKEIPYIKPTIPNDVLFPNSIY